MENIKFIEEHIEKCKKLINQFQNIPNELKDKYSSEEISKAQSSMQETIIKQLKQFEEIKYILEVWEICKKNSHINNYDSNNKRFDITIWLNTENCDFKSCASFEECLKVKKALEVEENDR